MTEYVLEIKKTHGGDGHDSHPSRPTVVEVSLYQQSRVRFPGGGGECIFRSTRHLVTPEPMRSSTFDERLTWYMHDYARLEPLATRQAKAVESALLEYGRSLFQQVDLGSAVQAGCCEKRNSHPANWVVSV